MKRRTIRLLSFLSAIFGIVTAFIGFFSTNKLMYLKLKDDSFIFERELLAKRFDEKWYDAVKKEFFWVESEHGYSLSAIFLKALNTKRVVVISHGVTENKVNSIKYARLFERLGYNAVIYDHRRHGESGGKTTSFGYYEKSDLQAVIHTIRQKMGDDALIGVHGESMGAATTLLYAGTYEDEADFYIADCPFSDFTEQLLHILRIETPFRTSFILTIANVFLKARDGYTLNLISPIEVVQNIDKPVLFIHSLKDTFILPYMTEELFEKKRGEKMLKFFEKGGHAQSFNKNEEAYEKVVRQFLIQYVEPSEAN